MAAVSASLAWLQDVEAKYGVAAWGVQSFYWKIAVYAALAVLLLAVAEQIRLFGKKGKLRGPWIPIPFIGAVIAVIKDPADFWERQTRWAGAYGLSWNSLLGMFFIFCTKTDISRFVLTNNSPNDFVMWMHPNGTAIFGKNNIVFMSGPVHKALRKSFLDLFTRKALSVYLGIQEKVIRQHINKWLKEGTPNMEMRFCVRDLNLQTSTTVFLGPYIEDRKYFSQLLLEFTEGFISLPINFPGTGLWKAVQARKKMIAILSVVVKKSKENMRAGKEPGCLLDFWARRILEEITESEKKGEPHPPYSADAEMATVVIDFHFAAQDASTSSLCTAIALLADHPDIREKICKEQAEVNPDGAPLTYELFEKMVYTQQVMKEVLRYRPPAPMVIQKATRDIRLTDDYVCPKGSLVAPSITAACQQGFTNPEKFDPDRMGPERREDVVHHKNYLVFGTGQHSCVGRVYAMNHLTTFLAVLSSTCTWTRKHTRNSHKVEYYSTVYPYDCLITLKAKTD